MDTIEQQFFNDLEKKLWTAADKRVVPGLIFLKYVSDAFEERQKELCEQFQNPDPDFYTALEDYADDYEGHIKAELEVRDYCTKKKSSGCRWKHAGKPCAIVLNCRPRRRCRGTSQVVFE